MDRQMGLMYELCVDADKTWQLFDSWTYSDVN